jgi:hypothetical protein
MTAAQVAIINGNETKKLDPMDFTYNLPGRLGEPLFYFAV